MANFTSIDSAFNAAARAYDAERRLLVPCFDQFYGNAIEIVLDAVAAVPRPRILDLGAGTGLLAGLLAHLLPNATFQLMDLSEGMLEEARGRFAGDTAARATFETANLTTYEPDGEWHAVVSALAIHHLTDPEKHDLYERVRRWLAPGGVFVNAEQVLGPTPELEALYDRVWQRQARRAGAEPAMIERAKARMAFDQCATVETQLEWLREAGYAQVDCTFKSWRFAVLAAWI